jgi:hypothetical protein
MANVLSVTLNVQHVQKMAALHVEPTQKIFQIAIANSDILKTKIKLAQNVSIFVEPAFIIIIAWHVLSEERFYLTVTNVHRDTLWIFTNVLSVNLNAPNAN